jgi:high-affinity K+ transport system ATPase subunit B
MPRLASQVYREKYEHGNRGANTYCGVGGVIVPFIGIKLIDVVMVGLHLAS